MSQVVGFLLLACCVAAFLSKVAAELRDIYYRRRFMAVERLAVEEFRANRPIDRVAIIQELVGALEPRMVRSLPADPVRANVTRRRIGSVHIAALASPCDEVCWSPFLTHRDPGDETSAAR